jgi:transposase
MADSEDLRKRVLSFVARGGSKVEAERCFEIYMRTVSLRIGEGCEHRRGKPGSTTSRKFSRDEMGALVKRLPDLLLKERAAHFGVRLTAIRDALIRIGAIVKNSTLRPSVRSQAPQAKSTLPQTPPSGRTRKAAAGLQR